MAVATTAGHAQSATELMAVPAPSLLGCLEPAPGSRKPAYPPLEAKLRGEGIVRIRLTFKTPTAAPRVDVAFHTGDDAFVEAVVDHVQAYRLPCMPAEAAPVVATQEFQFVSGDGRKVIYAPLRDDADAAPRLRCAVTGNAGIPDYPSFGGNPVPDATVVVKLTFVDAASPPRVDVVYDGESQRLASSVSAFVSKYRLPCLEAGAVPFSAYQFFTFLSPYAERYAFKDLPLRQFVQSLDHLDQQTVRFDLASMGCPFDIRFRLLQPYAPNWVGEVERADPNRREFLEWLKGVSMKLPRGAKRQLIGSSLMISVPCGILDLT